MFLDHLWAVFQMPVTSFTLASAVLFTNLKHSLKNLVYGSIVHALFSLLNFLKKRVERKA